jgi:hypothetical protein
MRISSTAYPIGIAAAVLLFAGCSASQSSLAPSSPVQPAHRVVTYHGVLLPTAVVPGRFARAAQGRAQIPTGMHRRTELLYLSYILELSGGDGAWSIPHLTFVYAITHGLSIPSGECSKTSRGAFWVADSGLDELVEFDYGGKRPVKTLSTSGDEPSGCSVDPASGNVAAAIISNDDVLVWPKGSGTPTIYTTPLLLNYFAGYDGRGDLFVDGLDGSEAFGLAELPKDGSSFELVTLDQSIEFPGNIQWDGSYLVIGDQEASVVYRVSCSRTSCSSHGSTKLAGASDCVQFWIRKATLACGDAGNGDAALWHYPAGGSPYSKTQPGAEPLGSVIVTK